MKKASTTKHKAIELNHGYLPLRINRNGAVEVRDYVELTASDLDGIAARSKLMTQPQTAVVEATRNDGYDVSVRDNGDVKIGCQLITAKDVARVHKISLEMRGRKATKKAKK